MDEEAIFRALFELSASVCWPVDPDQPDGASRTFITRTRRLKLFSEVPPKSQPWLGQSEHSDSAQQTTGLPYEWTLNAQWLIYHYDGADAKAVPTITNNLIVNAVRAAFAPVPSDPGFFDDRNTLSGLVHHCFISGEVFKDPGDIDKQALLVIPIRILVP